MIYTGQYGTKTGVTQTDGLFKNGDSPNFPWLDADGIPTLGSWLREAGYSTHYFVKWHVSNPPDHSLKRYGFDDWEESYPEPHGAQPNNLGVYRDVGFTDSACTFIRRKGLALNYNYAFAQMAVRDPNTTGPDKNAIPPWFAVASFTNPHDIATYPGVIAQALPNDDPDSKRATQSVFGPLTVPNIGDVTPPPVPGTIAIPLNPDGFLQQSANAAPTQNESLADKPTCQHEMAYKVGLALAAKGGFNIVSGLVSAAASAGLTDDALDASDVDHHMQDAIALSLKSCIPFQLSDDPDGNSVQFLQLYAWLHAVVDTHVDAVLTALDESGQADNTVVIFLSDHGEYGAAHGMMIEKWHAAYQEALHVPVVVRFPDPDATVVAGSAPEPVQIDALTSHIDILPTILGLAGVSADDRRAISNRMALSRPVPLLPGVDLSAMITDAANGVSDLAPIIEPDGAPREGVLFITDDEITAPLPPSRTATELHSYKEFAVYNAVVDQAITPPDGSAGVALLPGSIKQPNHVRCVRTADYKLARYFDPSGVAPQEWEMYDLVNDPIEAINLVEVHQTPPRARTDLADPAAMQVVVDRLAMLLDRLETRDL